MRYCIARSTAHALVPRRPTLLLILLATFAVSGALLAQCAQADDDMDNDPSEPGILVMKNHSVVAGRILRTGQNYLVKLPNGEMFVPAAAVRLRCRNIHDAYRQLRLAIPENHGAEHHMDLARWCITQSLFSEARLELKDALRMEPDRAEASDMLQRLDHMLDTNSLRKTPEKNIPAIVEAARKGMPPEEVESLGGLPQDAAVHFTRRIQPLLMSHCAKSGCHGPQEEQQFRLQRIIPGNNSSRHAVERNLANILKFIDVESPRRSQLLVKPKGAHGKKGRAIFIGQHGAQQYRELTDWVLTVAASREETKTVTSRKGASRKPGGKIQTVSHQTDQTVESSVETPKVPKEGNPFGDRTARRGRKPAEEPTTRRETQDSDDEQPVARDPFDPAEFNRLKGG